MRIKKINLKNFKRFTDLTISNIPEASKLVLLIGSNGSGKSSLFDAFDWISKENNKGLPYEREESMYYYGKLPYLAPSVLIEIYDANIIEKTQSGIVSGIEWVRRFLGRSSIRIVPRITNDADPANVSNDKDSPVTYIENDTRFITDVFVYIQQINNALREPVFKGIQADTLQIFRDFIEPLNDSLLRIFGGDENTTIQIIEFQDATPATPAKLIFKKGESKINYDLLSHGEKQVVILLIYFIVRRSYYDNSIVFIDEMDCHLNTALQSNLLEEIVMKWIPGTTQLWTASHAVGFIDYARKSDIASIIDFNLLDFDRQQELSPLPKNKLDVYEIAIPKTMIASILKGYTLVVVENKNDEYFNAALGQDGYLFLPANNNNEVFLTIKGDQTKIGLRDRDYLRPDEIDKIETEFPNLKILSLYNFENYIYHPGNIAELGWEGFIRQDYEREILRQKNDKLIEIVSEIGTSRHFYIEFKNGIRNDNNVKEITDALQSDTFEDFYPYFNMKKHFNKQYLTQFKYAVDDLSGTNWFKTQMLAILKKQGNIFHKTGFVA